MKITPNHAAVLLALLAPLAGAGHRDIVDTAANAGSFKTLLAAAKAADLVDALKGDGPLTVFAPTDDAFAKLPKPLLDAALKPENKELLVSILTYHVVAGRVSAADAVTLGRATTLAKKDVTVTIRDGRLRINDAGVVSNDIGCSNGVIHVIDQVLLPPNVAEKMGTKVIGVHVEPIDRALEAQLGIARDRALLVTGVTESGNARKAGVQPYDVIRSIDGRPATRKNLDRAKEERGIGGAIDLDVIRAGEPVHVRVEVGVDAR